MNWCVRPSRLQIICCSRFGWMNSPNILFATSNIWHAAHFYCRLQYSQFSWQITKTYESNIGDISGAMVNTRLNNACDNQKWERENTFASVCTGEMFEQTNTNTSSFLPYNVCTVLLACEYEATNERQLCRNYSFLLSLCMFDWMC